MNEKELLQALVGWKCPCCGTVHSPQSTICTYCLPPFLRKVAEELLVQHPRWHECPVLKSR